MYMRIYVQTEQIGCSNFSFVHISCEIKQVEILLKLLKKIESENGYEHICIYVDCI